MSSASSTPDGTGPEPSQLATINIPYRIPRAHESSGLRLRIGRKEIQNSDAIPLRHIEIIRRPKSFLVYRFSRNSPFLHDATVPNIAGRSDMQPTAPDDVSISTTQARVRVVRIRVIAPLRRDAEGHPKVPGPRGPRPRNRRLMHPLVHRTASSDLTAKHRSPGRNSPNIVPESLQVGRIHPRDSLSAPKATADPPVPPSSHFEHPFQTDV
jgi:hypothetical protein